MRKLPVIASFVLVTLSLAGGVDFSNLDGLAGGVRKGLWKLEFRVGTHGAVKTIEATMDPDEIVRTENARTLRWKRVDLDVGDDAVDVECRIVKNERAGHFEFRINVANRSEKYGLFETEYPRLHGVINEGEGSIIVPGNNWGGIRHEKMAKARFAYPDYHASAQLTIFERKTGGGVMIAAMDPGPCVKFLNYSDYDFSFSVPAADAGKAGAAGVPGFAFMAYPFEDSWWQAAKHYRQWAVENASWMKKGPLATRKDVPESAINAGLWSLVVVKDTVAKTDPLLEETLRRVNGRAPVSFYYSCWHKHPFDTLYPDYFPARDGFRESVARWQARGGIIVPYVNGRLWDRDSEDFERVRHLATRKSDGGEYTEEWHGRSFSAMCPSTKIWFDKMTEVGDRLVDEYGVKALFYDQVASMVALVCYASDHGHSCGGGTHWVDGYKKILAAERLRHPKVAISSENFSEPYVDVVDQFLTRSPCSDRDVPLIPAIYSGYCQTFGCRTDPFYTQEAFRAQHGRSFLWGGQPGWEGGDWIIGDRHRDKFEYLVKLAEMRAKYLDFFTYGELVGEVANALETPTLAVKWQRWAKPVDMKMPAVMATQWRARDGRETVFVCNYADTPQAFSSPKTGTIELAAGEIKACENLPLTRVGEK